MDSGVHNNPIPINWDITALAGAKCLLAIVMTSAGTFCLLGWILTSLHSPIISWLSVAVGAITYLWVRRAALHGGRGALVGLVLLVVVGAAATFFGGAAALIGTLVVFSMLVGALLAVTYVVGNQAIDRLALRVSHQISGAAARMHPSSHREALAVSLADLIISIRSIILPLPARPPRTRLIA